MAQGAVSFAGGLAGPYPQVFVVDSQASYSPEPSSRRRWRGVRGRALHYLVALAVIGMLMEAGCIMHLYNRTRDLINAAQPSAQQVGGTAQGFTGSEETNEIPVEPVRKPLPSKQKHSAHLRGSNSPVLADNVVPWLEDKSLLMFTHGMVLNDSRLVVRKEGYYYVYSKVHFVEDCSLFKHQVMMKTDSYGNPIVLMKANRYHCPTHKSKQQNSPQNIGNSYLGGVFHLSPGAKLYVTIDSPTLLKPGADDNFMGAFMI
ncbi:tumor necrosis factor ligand superfamily member 14 isoform X1 [Esox lucius]|uniref:THD domain-containing protein n=1 Tax=Esox lucius TaxID=8010 RepID=A0A3P8YA28_ESOLU|nr:tumor necrosis factor ligand superfamily member 14 isoform X1 [Esox lucius]XP_028977718.1 tumor necrosis factor ligand superfamily member 14 isoform X1 [Esox lucius]